MKKRLSVANLHEKCVYENTVATDTQSENSFSTSREKFVEKSKALAIMIVTKKSTFRLKIDSRNRIEEI